LDYASFNVQPARTTHPLSEVVPEHHLKAVEKSMGWCSGQLAYPGLFG